MSLIIYKWKQSQLQNIRKLQSDPFFILFRLSKVFELFQVPLQIILILILNPQVCPQVGSLVLLSAAIAQTVDILFCLYLQRSHIIEHMIASDVPDIIPP